MISAGAHFFATQRGTHKGKIFVGEGVKKIQFWLFIIQSTYTHGKRKLKEKEKP